jgi:hypothetical protein
VAAFSSVLLRLSGCGENPSPTSAPSGINLNMVSGLTVEAPSFIFADNTKVENVFFFSCTAGVIFDVTSVVNTDGDTDRKISVNALGDDALLTATIDIGRGTPQIVVNLLLTDPIVDKDTSYSCKVEARDPSGGRRSMEIFSTIIALKIGDTPLRHSMS